MGEFIREFMDRRRLPEGGPTLPPKIGLFVIVVGAFAVGFVIAGVYRLSVVAVVGALIFGGAALTWWLSDRARDRTTEVRWAALSLVCLMVGFFGWLVGMIKGW